MDPKDILQNARDSRDNSREHMIWAEQRTASVADDFIRLEVQIATILFAFSSLFLNNFNGDVLKTVSFAGLFIMKLAFAVSIFLLIGSLGFGLLYLKRCEQFWDATLRRWAIRAKKWDSVTKDKDQYTFEEAEAYHDGTRLDGGVVLEIPNWTWILQTILLGLAILIL